MSDIPVIDISALMTGDDPRDVVRAIDTACRESGFFCITGHGLSAERIDDLERRSRMFFALDEAAKQKISMVHAGRAWRGWFALGMELTNGVADRKEGIYFGTEPQPDCPRVEAGVPLHGSNLFPDEVPGLRVAVVEWMELVTKVGHAVMSGIAIGLGLPAQWFQEHLTQHPTVLFRIFNYPPSPDPAPAEQEQLRWGVAEHTDYGLLTLLLQDHTGGLQLRSGSCWIDVPPVRGALVCNIGDMLERLTGGHYRSTPHRVLNTSRVNRLSFPLFFDPGWDVEVAPLSLGDAGRADESLAHRWDGRSVFDFEGTYGEYLTAKVAKVFPHLFEIS